MIIKNADVYTEEGKFVKKMLSIEPENLKDVLARWFVHLPVSKVKKKYFTLAWEQECDEVVEDLNKHLADKDNMAEGDFAVCVCKDCGKQFVMTYKTHSNFKKLGLETPCRCKACVVARRAVKICKQS